jgi:hypothetical protein
LIIEWFRRRPLYRLAVILETGVFDSLLFWNPTLLGIRVAGSTGTSRLAPNLARYLAEPSVLLLWGPLAQVWIPFIQQWPNRAVQSPAPARSAFLI